MGDGDGALGDGGVAGDRVLDAGTDDELSGIRVGDRVIGVQAVVFPVSVAKVDDLLAELDLKTEEVSARVVGDDRNGLGHQPFELRGQHCSGRVVMCCS
jgi:hypothetical protein